MHTINILDMRTLLIGNVVCSLICVWVLALLWWYNHNRFPEIKYWLYCMAMQFSALLLIVLRGKIPDLFSIVLAAFLIMAGIMQLTVGLERFLGEKPSQQFVGYGVLVVFTAVHAYFTYVDPSLRARATNYSFFIILFSAQCAWLSFFRTKVARRQGAGLVGCIMVFYALLNVGRIAFYVIEPPSDDLFLIGPYDAFMYLAYQLLIIALTFSLVLMVNRRLYAELEKDVERSRCSEAAVRISENRLARAELAAKSGNWELHLDSREIICSQGAASVYGLQADRFSYERAKAVPLSEYRPKLDAAMENLIQNGAPYELEFRIRAVDTGDLKDIYSIATYDPETRTVFGVIQDITARKTAERELERLVQVDALTGVFTRRHFMTLAERELARVMRYGEKMSVMMVDVDKFKHINDTYGHQVGDRVLREIGLVFWAVFREADIVGRVGGEEFAVVLPQTEAMRAMEVAERFRLAVEHTTIALEHGLPFGMTVSIGVTGYAGSKTNFDTLLALADKALYKAKRRGRNQVCLLEG